jgi:alpha-beta hydrolase superfamily lysophospholipase
VDYGRHFTLPIAMRQCGTVCADGVELMGLVSEALVSGDLPLSVVYVPGQYENAYQPRRNHSLAIAASEAGIGVLLTNTRGQDHFGYQRRYPDDEGRGGYRWDQLGSSFERVSEAERDLDAWLSFVEDVAPNSRVVLVGHSHGAVKIANYLIASDEATRPGRLAGVVLLSPSDDIGAQRAELGDRYDEALDWAVARIENGDERGLMPSWAISAPMSASTYLEAYGPESPLRTFAFGEPSGSALTSAEAIWSHPTLVVFGSDDIATGGVSSRDAVEMLTGWFADVNPLDSLIVDGAEHEYSGHEDSLARSVVEWIGDSVRRT